MLRAEILAVRSVFCFVNFEKFLEMKNRHMLYMPSCVFKSNGYVFLI